MVVPGACWPAVAEPADAPGKRRVVGDDGAAVAQGAEVLRRVEAEHAGDANGPDGPSASGCQVRLTAVLDDRQVVAVSDSLERVMSAACPYRCTGRIARVRVVMARSTASGSIVNRRGSTSAKTGRAPAIRIASAVNAADNGVVMTSSPRPMPSARRMRASASVPVADTNGMCGSAGRCELGLERLHFRTEDEPAARDHAIDGRAHRDR